MSQQAHIGEGRKKKKRASKSSADKDDEFISSSSKKLKSLSEKLAWITSILKPPSKSKTTNPLSLIVKMTSSQYLIQNRTVQQTAYTKVCQIPTSCPPLNQRTGTHLPVTNLTPKSTLVRREHHLSRQSPTS